MKIIEAMSSVRSTTCNVTLLESGMPTVMTLIQHVPKVVLIPHLTVFSKLH